MSYSPSSSTTTPPPSTATNLRDAGIRANTIAAATVEADADTTVVPNARPTTTINPSPSLPGLDSSKLTITKTNAPKPPVQLNNPEIASQSLTTDHMLTATWSLHTGWSAPIITPYGPLSINPTASCLHYATECFEGLKAYRGYDGRLRLFRPQLNAQRFRKSAVRIALPSFDPGEFLKLLVRFVAFEGKKWLPDTPEGRGRFLYLRPTMIGTGSKIGIQIPEEAMLFVIAVFLPDVIGPGGTQTQSPPQAPGAVNAVSTPAGMRLLASQQDIIRAWPGGFGSSKVGANYGPTLVAQGEARSRGYHQVLWLFGAENYVTEAGAANFFVLWRKEDGTRELVTPPLEDGVILDGVTRKSVLEACREGLVGGGDIMVSERKVRMDEIVGALEEGRLLEAFAVGTAVFVAGVSEIDYRGKELILPLGKGNGGGFAMEVKRLLEGTMYGSVEHEWGYVVEEDQ